MTIRRMAALAAAFSILISGQVALAQDAPTEIKIATEGAYAPWNFTTANGQLDGLEVELANDLCNRMKIKCTIVAQDWDGLIPSLTVGKFDVIMASMFITPKRLESIDFTQPYAVDPSGFAVAKDSDLGKLGVSAEKFKLEDEAPAIAAIEKLKPLLKGKIVGVQAATTNWTSSRNISAIPSRSANTRRPNSTTWIWQPVALMRCLPSRRRLPPPSPSRNSPITPSQVPVLSAGSSVSARVQACEKTAPS